MSRLAQTSLRGLATIIIIVAISAIAYPIIPPVFAADGINKEINFQGKLTNPDGTNATTGSGYELVFRLYSLSSGGSPLWTETHSGMTITNGMFHVALGSITSLTSVNFNSDSLYLSIQVTKDSTGAATGEDEMDPRVRFTAVPYAFNAEKVNGLTVTNTSDNPFSTTTVLKLPDGNTYTIASPQSGTVDTVATLTSSSIFTNKIIGSTGLIFSGAGTDITTASGEDLVLVGNGAGVISLNDTVRVAGLSLGSVLFSDSDGDITQDNTNFFFNDTTNKFFVGAEQKAVLNVSGNGTNNAAAIFNQTDSTATPNILTASASGTTVFNLDYSGNVRVAGGTTIDTLSGSTLGFGTNTATTLTLGRTGENIALPGFAGNNAVLFANHTSGNIGTATTTTSGQCLLSGAAAAYQPAWTNCPTTSSLSWQALTAPTSANLSLNMATFTTTFDWATGTGSNNLFNLTTASSSNGTGYLLNLATGTSSTVQPFHVSAAGVEAIVVNATGNVGMGTTNPVNGKLEVAGADTADAVLALSADRSDDNGDTWQIKSLATNSFSVLNDATGSFVEVLNLTTAGLLQIDSNFTVSGGTITGANAENINIGQADNGSITFTGAGETNNNSLTIDLETSTYPIFNAGADASIGIDEDIIFIGIQSISTSDNSDLNFGSGAGTNDVNFLSTGGSTGDPDVNIAGYFQVNGTAEFNGTLQVDGALDINSADGTDFANSVIFNDDVDLVLAGSENLTIGNTTLSSTSNTLDLSATITANVSANLLNMVITNNAGAGTNYGMQLTNADNGGNTAVVDALALFSNDQAAETVADGVVIRHNVGSGTLTDGLQIENTTAGGTITNAINILETAGTITTGINIGTVTTGISIGAVTTGLSFASGSTTEINFADTTPIVSVANGGSITFNDGSTAMLVLADVSTSSNHVLSGDADTGLQISGATTDVTTASNEDLTLTAGGNGNVVLGVDGDTTVSMTFAAAPDSDMFVMSNVSSGATTTGIDGMYINYATAGTTGGADNAGLRIDVTSNNSGATTTLEGLYVGNLSSAEANSTERAIRVGTGWDVGLSIESGGIAITGGGITLTDAGTLTLSGSSRRSKTMTLSAEYPGAVLYGDGSNNTGAITSDYENNTTDTDGQRMTYYEWNGTTGASTDDDYDILVRFRLPDDFSAWAASTPVVFNFETESTTVGLNSVDYEIWLQSGSSADASDTGNVSGSAATWTTTSGITTASLSECDTAGEYCLVKIHMVSENSNYVRVGDIRLNYLASY